MPRHRRRKFICRDCRRRGSRFSCRRCRRIRNRRRVEREVIREVDNELEID